MSIATDPVDSSADVDSCGCSRCARRKKMISEAGILIATCFSRFLFPFLVIINGASAHLREYLSHRSLPVWCRARMQCRVA
jgi:hypothetical protein